MSILLFHRIRFAGALAALILALLYLLGFETISLIGFAIIGIYATITCIRLQRTTLPAQCDLCGAKSKLGVEYEHGFTNARLVLHCPDCGRVVNTSKNGIEPGKDRET